MLHFLAGAALSYKLGALTIVRPRKQAEQALGPKFDVRAFHDAVLVEGSVPLAVLEQQIQAYIRTAKSGSTVASAKPGS